MGKGTKEIAADQWPAQLSEFTKSADLLHADKAIMEAALNLVDVYEQAQGPLFMNSRTRMGFKRSASGDGKEMERAMLVVQQTILDHVFGNSATVAACASVLEGRKWRTASFFPGDVAAP